MRYTAFSKFSLVVLLFFFVQVGTTEAATLRLSPETGVYTVEKSFSISVLLNTEGKPVNAADGLLTFNPRELQVSGISRSSSIFNLWTEEPAYSNTAGTVSFGGGSPSGYKGSSGSVVTITFKPLGAGTPKVQFKSGSILAADGLGTNILSSMAGGTYTVSAPTDTPEPEYIAPPNTPKIPVITSVSHPDQGAWYKENDVTFSWQIPNDVLAIRTLLDTAPTTIPTIVYDERITEKKIDDIDEGTSFFHIQFKNKEGWGKIAHYRINIDSKIPTAFTISEVEDETSTSSLITLKFEIEDISPILEYKIQLDGKEPLVFKDTELLKRYAFTDIIPGYHTVVVEAFDSAGNSSIATYSFTLEALPKPIFIDFPTRINTEVIPVIKGKTIPHAHIAIQIKRAADGVVIQTAEGNDGDDLFILESNEEGEFTYIPASSFAQGVYSITAVAKDSHGRMSEVSDAIRIIVEAPGYVVVGSFIISVLSIIVPLCALSLLLLFGSWYLWHRLKLWKKRVRKETLEAEDSLTLEFNTIVQNLHSKVGELKESRKGKLTKAESDLITQIEDDITHARSRIKKEIDDIEDVMT